MRKILFAALAAMVLFASCDKNENAGMVEKTQLTVKISGAIKTKAVEAPGVETSGIIQLTSAHIFVIDPLGTVTHAEELVIAEVIGNGQVLDELVPSDARVYIIGNIPTSDVATITGLGTFNAIQAAVSDIATQVDYTVAALANADGLPAAITVGTEEATVDVSISPLISRLELVQVEGGANAAGDAITAFDVTGVFVDSYYPSFTYVGGFSGDIFSQGTSTAFAGIGDEGTWTASSSPFAAAPANGDVWAYNVASGGTPRFIIRLENVKYVLDGDLVEREIAEAYLTVTSYEGVSAFERGKIYRIGCPTGGNNFSFNTDNLGLTPNPVDKQLKVNVSIVEWEITYPSANL